MNKKASAAQKREELKRIDRFSFAVYHTNRLAAGNVGSKAVS